MMNHAKNLLLLIALLFTALGGCSETASPDPGVAKVKIFHASPDAPGLNVEWGEERIATNRVYKDVTTYLHVEEGTKELTIAESQASTSLLNPEVSLLAENDYTVILADHLTNLRALIFNDDLTAPENGKAHIRFIHLVPDAPAVSIKADGTTELATTLEFAAIAQAFRTIDAGAMTLTVHFSEDETDILIEQSFTPKNGEIYTVCVIGLEADNTVALKIIEHN